MSAGQDRLLKMCSENRKRHNMHGLAAILDCTKCAAEGAVRVDVIRVDEKPVWTCSACHSAWGDDGEPLSMDTIADLAFGPAGSTGTEEDE